MQFKQKCLEKDGIQRIISIRDAAGAATWLDWLFQKILKAKKLVLKNVIDFLIASSLKSLRMRPIRPEAHVHYTDSKVVSMTLALTRASEMMDTTAALFAMLSIAPSAENWPICLAIRRKRVFGQVLICPRSIQKGLRRLIKIKINI